MIEIRISFLSVLSDITSKDEIKLSMDNNPTVKEIIDRIILDFGKKFGELILKNPNEINDYILIAKNGKDIRTLNYLDSLLQDGDELSFLPAIAGG